jgi:hypothetical protein
VGAKKLPPGAGTKLFIAALLVIGGAVLAVYSITLRDDAVSEGAGNAALGVGVGIGLLFVLGAWGLVRKVFPPKLRGLHITCAQQEVRRGGFVDVQFEVTNPSKVGEGLELGLVCTEFYDVETTDANGNSSRNTHDAPAHEDWRPQTPEGGTRNVRFEVPREAPYSYRGGCLSFVWRVSAREPKKLRFDRAFNVEITVLP